VISDDVLAQAGVDGVRLLLYPDLCRAVRRQVRRDRYLDAVSDDLHVPRSAVAHRILPNFVVVHRVDDLDKWVSTHDFQEGILRALRDEPDCLPVIAGKFVTVYEVYPQANTPAFQFSGIA